MSEDRTPTNRKRSAARLAAVQGIYEMDVAGAPPDIVISEFLKDRWLDRDEDPPLAELDVGHFAELIRAVAARREAIDTALDAALAQKLKIDRLEVVLRAILRAGAYELSARPDIPANVIINEYLDVAHAFYSGKEPGLINAVLDTLAAGARPDEAPAGATPAKGAQEAGEREA